MKVNIKVVDIAEWLAHVREVNEQIKRDGLYEQLQEFKREAGYDV